jgi:hypothetical protein
MAEPLVIEIHELRSALELLLDAVEQRFGSSLELDADYYWMLDQDAAYDMNTDPPTAVLVGQLTDDVTEMRTILSGREVVSVWHDLRHVVGVLSRVAALDCVS